MSFKDWKLKLRYGKTKTLFKHYTVIGNCEIGDLDENFSCPKGQAYVGMKIWALNTQEAADVFYSVGEQIGFTPIDKVEVFDTDAVQPPQEEAYAYDITFTPYN